MEYTVVVKQTPEGFSAWVPGLPGCWSEGDSEEEALANIQDAIGDYLAVADQIAAREKGALKRSVTVKVA